MAEFQNECIKSQEMIVIDGGDPATRTAARLTIEETNANIAAMQQQSTSRLPPKSTLTSAPS